MWRARPGLGRCELAHRPLHAIPIDDYVGKFIIGCSPMVREDMTVRIDTPRHHDTRNCAGRSGGSSAADGKYWSDHEEGSCREPEVRTQPMNAFIG
jgi:hypothetical protein